tara:strand:+ start:841 stop:2568 length:1728 start_codon:yes stop_codon:yes gene_type:complete
MSDKIKLTTNFLTSKGARKKSGEKSIDRLRGNVGRHSKNLHRLSSYSDPSNISQDVRNSMEALPKADAFARDYYNTLGSQGRQKSKNHFSFKDSRGKIDILRRISEIPEVTDILTKLVTEIITPSEGKKHFCEFFIDRIELEKYQLKDEYITKLEELSDRFFPLIYKHLGLKLNGAKKFLHSYLVEGKKAYEIVYDNPDNPTKFIGMAEIDGDSLEKIVLEDGIVKWQYIPKLDQSSNNGVLGIKRATNKTLTKRILHDWQVVVVDWNDENPNSHISYVHTLMKDANVLRIMEETMLIWYVTTSSYRTIHKIPTQGLTGTYAAQTVLHEKQNYTTDIEYDNSTGELYIDDSTNIPFERTTFIADGEYGEPTIDTINDRGTPLDDPKSIEYFKKKLYRTSQMPQSRFDDGAGDWSIDPTRAQREEVYFDGFCDVIKNSIAPIFLKPFLVIVGFEIKEINSDYNILDNINLSWNSINQFKKLLDLAVMSEKISYIEKTAESLVMTDVDGDEYPIIPIEILLQQHLGYTKEDMEVLEEKRMESLERKLLERKKVKELKEKYGLNDDDEDGGGGGRRRR